MIKKRRSQRFDGFSLIEVLLVLALVGVLAGLVAGNAGAFIKGAQFEPPSRVLKKAILDAIYEASESKELIYLTYIQETATFRVSNKFGTEINSHKIFKGEWEAEHDLPEIIFKAIGPGSGLDGGTSIYDEGRLVLTKIPFHYGSSVPFMTQIRFMDEMQELQFDPFSGFVLNKKE